MRHERIVSVFVVFALTVTSSAATIVVDVGSAGQYADIQSAIDAAAGGDTVLVKPGQYVIAESLTFRGKGIAVRGEAGPAETTIRMSDAPSDPNAASVVVFTSGETSAAILEGLTITGGKSHGGGGVHCGISGPTLINCVISGNSASEVGGGVYCSGYPAPTLTNCVIRGNAANHGGGVYCESAPSTLTGCTIRGNRAEGGGGGMYCSGTAGPRLGSCTIAGNTAGWARGGGVLCREDCGVVIAGCIIWGNAGGALLKIEGTARVTVSYSCIEGPSVWPGTGNIASDPRFCAWPAGDVWVDAGRTGPGTGTQADPYARIASALDAYRLSLGRGSPCIGGGEGGKNMGAALGVSDSAGSPSCLLHLAPGRYRMEDGVLADRASIAGGDLATTTLEGTVYGLRTGAIFSGVTVTGGADCGVVVPPDEAPAIRDCAIAGNTGAGVFCFEGSSPTLTDCTISGNDAASRAAGGGVCCDGSSPALTRCTITGNTAAGGGGVFCASNASPTLTDCTILGNAAGIGGGVYCGDGASPLLNGCIVAENTATSISNSAGGGGGGVFCAWTSVPSLVNCTITGNWGWNGGGIAGGTSALTLVNCIVWDNMGDAIWTREGGGVPAVTYSCIETPEPWPGTGNINVDPRFCGWPASEVWVAAGGAGPGSGTRADPYPRLEPALRSHRLSLAHGSPCLGSGEGGKDMGAIGGACADAGTRHCTVHLGAGSYCVAGLVLSRRASIEGDGRETTMLRGTVYGLRTGAFLAGVTVTEGSGGGIVLAMGEAPEIRDCAISGNAADADLGGGGVSCYDSAPTFTNCAIEGNRADKGGGAYFWNSAPTLTGCSISGNAGTYGGGGVFFNYSSPKLTHCTLAGNTAHQGGGVLCHDSGPTLTDCVVSGNAAVVGGGIRSLRSSLWLLESTIEGNSAGYGAGAFCEESAPTMRNCAFTGNSGLRGGSVFCQGASPRLTNCTLAGNTASGIDAGILDCDYGSSPKLVNCIVWGNAGRAIAKHDDASAPAVTYSCIEGAWPGAGNRDGDPLFARTGRWEDCGGAGQPGCLAYRRDPLTEEPVAWGLWIAGDYRLGEGSPCIDAGTSAGAPATDLQGHPRPCGDAVDIGAYEFCVEPPSFKRGDANTDGRLDVADAIWILSELFRGGRQTSCREAADADDDGTYGISDAVAVLKYFFADAGPLPDPFGVCGADSTVDELGCLSYPACEM